MLFCKSINQRRCLVQQYPIQPCHGLIRPDPYNGEDHLTMGYFDNLDNEFLNKYEKNLKIEKKSL
jgi:hypothetical protein